jgi:hypothetical protein
MKFYVSYKEKLGQETVFDSIIFEAADLETCKTAVAQWQRNEARLKGRIITILSITKL